MVHETPGVYVEEISGIPPSVAEVETAIPAFIGYTEMANEKGDDLTNKPKRINSLLEFGQFFGGPARPAKLLVQLDASNAPTRVTIEHDFQLYYSLRLFYENGGGDCYIVSVGPYTGAGTKTRADMKAGIEAIGDYDDPTLILFPDAALMGAGDLGSLQKKTLSQCAKLQDRFAVFDLDESKGHSAGVIAFRDNVGTDHLKYGAAYTPHLQASIPLRFSYQDITLEQGNTESSLALVTNAAGIKVASVNALDSAVVAHDEAVTVFEATVADLERAVANGESKTTINDLRDLVKSARDDIESAQAKIDSGTVDLENTNPIYAGIVAAIQRAGITLPPSGAAAGVYAKVDKDRGVWKAPANFRLRSVIAPTFTIDDADQEHLNVDRVAGKSINAIRSFRGHGIFIWGARTLAGNDNEWRYVPVRRFFNMVEESVKKSTAWAVFEPNDARLWTKVKTTINNYLTLKWRDGALAGAKPEDAFFVKVGLGETMTAQDILEGRLAVEIGMAPVRPAEFIILKFSHKMPQ